MKKILWLVLLTFSSIGIAQAASQADSYEEGIDYKTVDQQPVDSGKNIEVLEFFWYGCPHCYHFEPNINAWKKSKPANVTFTRVPAVFRPDWKVQARAYYALELMGEVENMHAKIFNAIHKDKKKLNTLDAMADFVAENGVDKEKFIAEYNSFSVDGMVRKAVKKLSAYKINGVPTLAINGKYTVSGQLAGTHENMIKVTDYLIEKESAK